MNVNQLKYFISVAELRSFSAAAAAHYITQTAMTQQIRTLEETVGCQLIDRSSRPVRLTPSGVSFLADARRMCLLLSGAIERANDAAEGQTGTLRIGYLKGYERSDLSNRLRAFHRLYPGIRLTCSRDTTDRLAAALRSDEYDLIYTWDSTRLRANPDFASEEVERARLTAALYAAHPLVQREFLTRQDLSGEPIIYMSPSEENENAGDSVFLAMYRNAGYEPNIILRSTDVESILILVAAEEGVSILPDYCVRKITNADGIVFLPMQGAEEVEEIHMLWKKNNPNPALARFLSMAR